MALDPELDTPQPNPMHLAQTLIDDDKLLQGARVIRNAGIAVISEQTASPTCGIAPSDAKLVSYMHKASVLEELVGSLKSSPGDGWSVQGEHLSNRDISIYYRLDEETQTKLTARIESPIDKSLLVPLLSVLNESELFHTWLPNWKVPRLKVRRSHKLTQSGRCSQVVLITVDLPWPLSPREVVLDACAVDDIDVTGDIAALMRSLHAGDTSSGIVVPAVDDSNIIRIDFHGGFLFRRLPEERRRDREAAASAVDIDVSEGSNVEEDDEEYETASEGEGSAHGGDTIKEDIESGVGGKHGGGDDRILVSVQIFLDPKLPYIPSALLNFVIRTVLYLMWAMLLRVAEGIRDGKMPEHAAAIAQKRETLYDWVDARVKVMLARLLITVNPLLV